MNKHKKLNKWGKNMAFGPTFQKCFFVYCQSLRVTTVCWLQFNTFWLTYFLGIFFFVSLSNVTVKYDRFCLTFANAKSCTISVTRYIIRVCSVSALQIAQRQTCPSRNSGGRWDYTIEMQTKIGVGIQKSSQHFNWKYVLKSNELLKGMNKF